MGGQYDVEKIGEDRRAKFKSVGIAEIVIASVSIVLEIATINLYSRIGISTTAPGIWSGIWVIVAGSLALTCSKNPSKSKLISGWVFAGIGMGLSCYMVYYEANSASIINRLELPFPTLYTHALLVITGIGHIVSTSFHTYFARKAKKEACS